MLIARAIVVDDHIVPQPTNFKARCGWRFEKIEGGQGLADGIIFGPGLTNTKSNVDRSLFEEWARNSPRKTTLWSNKHRRQLPKLLLVTEEWTSPTWTYVVSAEHERDPGSSAVGLITVAEGAAGEWRYLVLPEEDLICWGRFGNTEVRPS